MNHPEELIAQLRILGRLEEFGSGARFARRFQGAGAEERIHWHLRRTLLRAPPEDGRAAAAARPSAQVVVPVALENEREYRLAEKDVVAWLREQPLDLGELEAKVAADAARRAARAAQRAASGSPRAASSARRSAWIDDFLASEEPLVVFAGNREVQELVRASASRTRCTSSAPTRSSSARPRCRRSRSRTGRS